MRTNILPLILSFILLSISQLAIAEDVKELTPLDPKYMGVHGMKLFNKGPSVFASYMLKLTPPYNVQVLYKLNIDSLSLLQLVKDAELVTIKTEEFNLQRLMRGESFEVNADIYMGHYKKGGLLTFSNTKISFDEKLFVKVLDDLEESNNRQKYDVVKLKNDQRILIHQIQKPPSYEHLIYLSDDVNCITNFTASSPVPAENEIHYKLTYCGAMKPLYYNSEDFL